MLYIRKHLSIKFLIIFSVDLQLITTTWQCVSLEAHKRWYLNNLSFCLLDKVNYKISRLNIQFDIKIFSCFLFDCCCNSFVDSNNLWHITKLNVQSEWRRCHMMLTHTQHISRCLQCKRKVKYRTPVNYVKIAIDPVTSSY